ncbi:hypothetical protein [Lutibaculum baratangense]|nr:hypothetical protein [Lutibaculum baratangense]
MHVLSRVLPVAVLAILLAAGPAGAWGWGTENRDFLYSTDRVAPWAGPACDDPKVAARIVERFNQNRKEYWSPAVLMNDVVYAREVATNQWDPPLIATRYCNATAYLSDGSRHDVTYWLRSEQGFAGVGWGLQFCVAGFDEHMAYAPACRMLRP